INHDQKIINIHFSSPSFRNAFQHKYRYRIIGLDTNWREVSAPELTLTGLSPGSYNVEIDKKNLEGKWGNNLLLVPLSVLPPFYKTWWFMILSGLMVATIFGYIAYIRILSYKRESMLQIGLVKTRNQTLSSQLNPHFL